MPDICMCPGYKRNHGAPASTPIEAPVSPELAELLRACPLKDGCYRFTATPSEHRQSYFVEAPFVGQDIASCEHFVERY